MFDPTIQTSLLHILHAQYRAYTTELADTHKQLGIQYNKIAKAVLALLQRNETNLSRQEKKTLQWRRARARNEVKNLQSQQAWLHDYLRGCGELIARCEQSSYGDGSRAVPATPWSAAFDPMNPMSGLTTPVPWSAVPMTPFHSQPMQHGTQCWDLSMLQERGDQHSPSPCAPSWTPDSGFHETSDHLQSFRNLSRNEAERATAAELPSPSSKKSSISEHDNVPDLLEPSVASPSTRAGATHKRRFSENAIQLD